MTPAVWVIRACLIPALTASQSSPLPPEAASLATKAAAARDANRPDDALRLYNQALKLAPRWAEGWWQAGAIYYGKDQYPQCRDAFRRFVSLETKVSTGYAFLGLCEFQTLELRQSVSHMERALQIGLPKGEQLTDVVLYHLALVHTKGGNFERALQVCSMLANKAASDPKVAGAAGIASLRRAIFPHELPESDRDAAFRLGTLVLSVGTRPVEEIAAGFDGLIRDYPKLPSLHYTYATFLLPSAPDKGVEQLTLELEISPDHLPALISLAFEYLARGDAASARPFATRAVKLAPGSFAAHACLGRVLLEGDKNLNAAIHELETAVKLAPESPQIRFSLASAYTRAGRKEDAARQKAEFARLKKLIEVEKPADSR